MLMATVSDREGAEALRPGTLRTEPARTEGKQLFRGKFGVNQRAADALARSCVSGHCPAS